MSRLPDPGFWTGKRVFLTGHTGFKGSWARLWLTRMGARVTGYALRPDAAPSLHDLVGAASGLETETIADIRDQATLRSALEDCDPEIILHMAAQPLVRKSYAAPTETFEVNVMGTVNLLEAARSLKALRALLVVTTDKVYGNDETGRHFVETDRLGGHDPYSGSKAAAELVVSTYRDAFFRAGVARIATARGGNVLGGGDFSQDRIVPDIVRAAMAGKPLDIRNPYATRPWQHVLDCLNGYLLFSEALFLGHVDEDSLNFGPSLSEPQMPVGVVASAVNMAMGLTVPWRDVSSCDQPREMQTLGLDPDRAARTLGWHARLSQLQTMEWTAQWYDGWRKGAAARDLSLLQIEEFTKGF
ncbi:CDP-glucose 4,6-dehydratase [Rhizobium tubonense]|uniref:CDP-glucose 4,6-dehydratase n=1 Tax=Rhizobium tubonense TaxID=484088 RepID=A0A2W4CPN1_9HYPH|nr:CDP-glucose 4,6-dehydratase [Rhizobium tubonense]PZM07414.1 CDP-glucose 4,6-dehydratase [Rhizobium tubonense]